jgi:hypothetical protein
MHAAPFCNWIESKWKDDLIYTVLGEEKDEHKHLKLIAGFPIFRLQFIGALISSFVIVDTKIFQYIFQKLLHKKVSLR